MIERAPKVMMERGVPERRTKRSMLYIAIIEAQEVEQYMGWVVSFKEWLTKKDVSSFRSIARAINKTLATVHVELEVGKEMGKGQR